MGMKGTASFVREWVEEKCGGYAVIDGGLATELERHGADLKDPLWSAKCLLSDSHLLRKVHLDYIEAGANILITASYQATLEGFEAKGYSREEGEALIRRSVEIACEARDMFMVKCLRNNNRSWPWPCTTPSILIAASVGSYGAYLADGSEYSGDYGNAVTVEKLKNFHRRRLQILVDSNPDLIAFETIPNKIEAQAYAELLEEEDIEIPAWFSFSCKDGSNVASGDSIAECAAIAESCSRVAAIGVNCTAPRHIHSLIESITKVTNKPVLVYPNSGEIYDGETKQWMKSSGEEEDDFVSYVAKWRDAGASLFGGCCRTTPNTIKAIAKTLSANASLDDHQDS